MSSQSQPRAYNDDDDFDDLDDIADQFDTHATSSPVQPGATQAIKSPHHQDTPEFSEDFIKEIEAQVKKEMDFMNGTGCTKEELEARDAWQQHIISEWNAELEASAESREDSTESRDASGPRNTDLSFQSNIRKAMDKLRTSDIALSSGAPTVATSTEPLEALRRLGSSSG